MSEPKFLTVAAPEPSTIVEAYAHSLCEQARRLRVPVGNEFNEIPIYATPTDHPADVTERWNDLRVAKVLAGPAILKKQVADLIEARAEEFLITAETDGIDREVCEELADEILSLLGKDVTA